MWLTSHEDGDLLRGEAAGKASAVEEELHVRHLKQCSKREQI